VKHDDTEEEQTPFQIRLTSKKQKENDANDAQRKAESLARKTTRKEDSKTLPEQKHLL